jgi:hypothetical protein
MYADNDLSGVLAAVVQAENPQAHSAMDKQSRGETDVLVRISLTRRKGRESDPEKCRRHDPFGEPR